MKLLGIDPGILNLAIVGAEINNNNGKQQQQRKELILPSEINFCEKIDITDLVRNCPIVDCKLYHSKTICDYMTHLFEIYKDIFANADQIIVERQPPTGLIAVQDIILKEFRDKTILISPTSMLKFFDILKLERDTRKELNVKRSYPFLSHFKEFCFNERKHDMADAFCLIYYSLHLERERINAENQEIERTEYLNRYRNPFEPYRYIEPINLSKFEFKFKL